MNADILSDAARKSHLRLVQFTPREIAEMEAIAAQGVEVEEVEEIEVTDNNEEQTL